MNLLPFVIIIVLILGMFAESQFSRNISLNKEHDSYIAYFSGLRKSRNDAEDSAYSQAYGRKATSTKESLQKKDIKLRDFARFRMVGWPAGRLNLSSLLNEKDEELEKLAVAYLNELYKGRDFLPKDLHTFFKTLVAKVAQEDKPLHELSFEDPEMQKCFYKMVRGTHTYDIFNHVGYPPFDHFFTFEKISKNPMNFHAANPLFLKVALGEKKANELIRAEEGKKTQNALKSPLTEEERTAIFQEDNTKLVKLFYFATPKAERNPEMHVDQKTNITVRID